MNQLRQIIDIKNRKVKTKNYEGAVFGLIIEKEQTRIMQENQQIAKLNLKVDDKNLVKITHKQVKKMLKPFKGL
jgi:hypothetical protein